MFVKICGITNLEDAISGLEAGADALGFNFYRHSPRYLEPSKVRSIIATLSSNIRTVGVFVNEDSPETVSRIADEAGVEAIQLHGDESPEFCAALSDRYVIKVLPIGPGFQPQRALDYDVPAFMVDAFDKARGGTGRTVDWSEAQRVRRIVKRLFLAGGLSESNVEEAIAVVKPHAVDACSALEITPGKKDRERVRLFVEAARRASKLDSAEC